MGIPGYFSHIIKNYPNIIRNLQYFTKKNCTIQHLFMDCNSLVYDAYNNLSKDDLFVNQTEPEIEKDLIEQVIMAIKLLIQKVSPTDTIMIAFDGVAPFAKMEQQRTRRYRTDFITKTTSSQKIGKKWNTAAITPGTSFMDKLAKTIEYEFQYTEKFYHVKNVIVSCSNIPGEGEHKIMDNIRSSESLMKDDNVALYGLDSDLIMLSIFQLDYCKNIYVFREATEFIKSSIPTSIISDSSNLYFLDIYQLVTFIIKEMKCEYSERTRVYDYVFMCFLLGNDFLPHFPSFNIRSNGIDLLTSIYRIHLGSYPLRTLVTKDKKIQWANLHRFLSKIEELEHSLLLHEYSVREKWGKRSFLEKTDEEREEIFQNTPILYRGEEEYICPRESGWETRYYDTLFHNNDKKAICINYLEGLEWVFNYYTSECCSWRWKYNYHYPPLLKDLIKYIPHFDTNFIQKKEENLIPFTHDLQLAYVLPKSQFHLLQPKIHSFLLEHYPEHFLDEFSFQWAFCRYFWESHPLLPDTPLELLEQWDTQFKMSQVVPR